LSSKLSKSEIIARLDFSDSNESDKVNDAVRHMDFESSSDSNDEDLMANPALDNPSSHQSQMHQNPDLESISSNHNDKENLPEKMARLVCYSDDSDDEIIPQTPHAYSTSKNPVLLGCGDKCKQKCTSKINDIRRKLLNREFWSKNYDDRKKWIAACCERAVNGKLTTKRRTNISYKLRTGNGELRQVCQKFFLSTIGKKDRHDQIIRTALDTIEIGEVFPTQSKKGKHIKRKVYDRDLIKKHIMSFNPQISHYRRMHAPNRLYLTSDINIRFMHSEFIKTHNLVSYSVYHKVVNEMNISFTKLGEEECETCSKYDFHVKSCDGNNLDCLICLQYSVHKETYQLARESYKIDKESGKKAFAVDLQKVGLLPRIPQFKTVIFTPRLVTFNETFAPLAQATSNNPNITVLWHEATSGRNAADLASAFWSFFTTLNCSDPIILWLDNCSAQNKNWILFSMLVRAVNHFNFPSVTLKFFEPGHTFMAADSVHAGIEKEMKKQKVIFDFPDYISLVERSNSKGNKAIPMSHLDFKAFEDESSTKKLKLSGRPKLAQLYIVEFRKRSQLMFYALDHKSKVLKHFDFLKKGLNSSLPQQKEHPRGILQQKKAKICKNLLPLMPTKHHLFWRDLPENESSSDLLTQQATEEAV